MTTTQLWVEDQTVQDQTVQDTVQDQTVQYQTVQYQTVQNQTVQNQTVQSLSVILETFHTGLIGWSTKPKWDSRVPVDHAGPSLH